MDCGLIFWLMLVPHLLWLALAFKPAFLFELPVLAPVVPVPPTQIRQEARPRNNRPRPPPSLSF